METATISSFVMKNTSAVSASLVSDGGPTMRALFGVVAVLSLIGNILLCIVMLRRRAMLTKTYNILIFNLAIADLLTGLFLFITPRYVLDQNSFPRLSGLGGDVFCRLVWSTYFLFMFGKASNATVMCLAIDRWYSIIKPIKYKIAFGRRRLYSYIALTWITSAVTEAIGLFIAKQEDGRCTWDDPPYSEKAEQTFILIHVIVTFYLPSLVTWGSFAQIWYNMSRTNMNRQRHDVTAKKRLVRMCALAAFFLTLCWFPTETFFVLKKFHILELPDAWYWVFNLLGMFNSCINPWLYCLSNKTYRREFMSIVPFAQAWETRRVSWQPTVQFKSQIDLVAWDSTAVIQNLSFTNRARETSSSI